VSGGRYNADVDAPHDYSAEDVARLRDCVNDLASFMTLPALWTGGEPALIVSTLLDALLGTLRLSFVCVRLNDPEGGRSMQTVRVAESLKAAVGAEEISQAIDSSLGDAPATAVQRIRISLREINLSVASTGLGLRGEIGIVAAGSVRADFPTQTERLLLDVAASQATVSLQLTRLVRESERESRLIVDSIPALVATFTPAGEVEFVNRRVLEYYGRTLDELRRWETTDATHPEDLPRAIELFTHSIASGDPFEFEVRTRRFDGVYRWFQSRGFPLRDTHGRIVRWYNLLIDIDERKRA
jgi:PAS domain S-box-containing protein